MGRNLGALVKLYRMKYIVCSTYSTEANRVVTLIATFHAISVAGTAVDAIDFVSITVVHSVAILRIQK